VPRAPDGALGKQRRRCPVRASVGGRALRDVRAPRPPAPLTYPLMTSLNGSQHDISIRGRLIVRPVSALGAIAERRRREHKRPPAPLTDSSLALKVDRPRMMEVFGHESTRPPGVRPWERRLPGGEGRNRANGGFLDGSQWQGSARTRSLGLSDRAIARVRDCKLAGRAAQIQPWGMIQYRMRRPLA